MDKNINKAGKRWKNDNPLSFINQVIYFDCDPMRQRDYFDGDMISFIDIFTDQIDIKIIEEDSEEERYGTRANFFYKS